MNKQQEPRLRFQGFAGAWEEKKIGEILSEVRRSIYLEDSEKYQLVTVKRRNEGVVSRGYLLGKDILVKNYSQLKTNDYLISKRQIIHGANGIVPSELDNAIVSNEYLVVVSNNDVRTEFLTLVSRTPSMYRKFLLSSYGVDIEKMVFNVEDWKSREITLPSLPEQTHLSLFFRRLDSQIAESRAVLEKSRQLKKAMLAKMFPANGEKIPKIRFKGFEGEWERNELGCLGYCLSGIGFSENEQGGANGIPFFKVSDMNLSGNEVYLRKANNYVTQEQIDKQRWQVIQQLPCIFFAKVGAALLLNRKRLVNTPFLLDNNTMAFILDSSLDNYFMKTLFDTIDLPALAQIGALPSINAKDIEKNIVFIPTPKEQTAIGNFFRQLDETIALQSAEVEKLNQLKKGLLAAMLV